MNRSKKIIVISHCILNANAKVAPLAEYPGVLHSAIEAFIKDGTGIVQLPCPESSYLGINRWGMCYEQYDHPKFRRHCRKILKASVDQLETFIAAGYHIRGVIGADGSPNCGVNKIPSGLTGGVIRDTKAVETQLEKFQYLDGMGVFMGIFKNMLSERNISIDFMAIDEKNPSHLTT